MRTKNQFLFFKNFLKKKAYSRSSKLFYKNNRLIKCPQLLTVVLRVCIVTPKKPNSARRPVVKVVLKSKKMALAHIKGIGHNLKKHSETLINGRGCRDLPGVNYSCVRGKYSLLGVLNKTKRRSIYGIKRPDILKKKLRRKFRKIFK
jgi:small subunit ribosomal protein S12